MQTWWLNNISDLEQHLLPCPFKWLSGCDCPACGTQRSIIHLLRGEIQLSWQANPLGLGIIALVMLYMFTSKISSSKWFAARKIAVLIVLATVIVHWLSKMLDATCTN